LIFAGQNMTGFAPGDDHRLLKNSFFFSKGLRMRMLIVGRIGLITRPGSIQHSALLFFFSV
jgi:hypothetical protein